MVLTLQDAKYIDMMKVHQHYESLMNHGPKFIKAINETLGDAKSKRKGTKLVEASEYQSKFTCFSISLLLRVEFEIPNEEEKEGDNVQGELVLYKYNEDDELEPFKFVKDLEGDLTNFYKFNARGYGIAYEPEKSIEADGFLKDKSTYRFAFFQQPEQFAKHFLDKLELFIAASGVRVIPK